MNIDKIFEGVWVSDEEYLIRCPICGDHSTHNHCYINVGKGTFFCHYHGEGGSIYKVLDEADVDLELRPKGAIRKKEYKELDFSVFKPIRGIKDTNDRLAMSYLKKRGLNKDEVSQYDVRYCPDSFNKYYGRVIFPIFENEEMVCFSARAFLGFIRPKYLFPHEGETKITAGEAIFGYSRFKDSKSGAAILVEGVLDAILVNQKAKVHMHGLSLLSSDITNGQLRKLSQLKTVEFYIMLDSDAKRESLKMAEKLFKNGYQVYVSLLEGGDPASVAQAEFDRAIREAIDYCKLEERLKLEMRISRKRF